MSTLEVKEKALQLGYLACGIIPSNIFQEYAQYLDERKKSFPESREMYEPLYDFAILPKEAKSVIVCTRRYNQYKIPVSLDGLIGKFYLFDSRLPYSHENRAGAEFEGYLKTLGITILQCNVPDRLAAAKAGLGKFGRNNFIYSPEHGSYIWIETWVVDTELDYDAVREKILLSECNDNCQKCIQSCPTKALSSSLSMDRGKCVTQLNCFSQKKPDEKTRAQMGLWLYGCDTCQDVCPVNKGKFSENEEFPLLNEFEEYLKPENLLEMDEDTFTNIINPRFWYIDKDSLWLWKCNALRCMINSGDSKYHHLIKKYHKQTDI
jgi:epoxyqueuosine reductase